MADETQPSKPNVSGGCAMGCASVFVVAGLAWPAFHLVRGTTEPEVMFVPFVIGVPAFVVAHLLALVALRSRSPETKTRGKRALYILWGSVAIVALFGVLAWLVDLIRGRA